LSVQAAGRGRNLRTQNAGTETAGSRKHPVPEEMNAGSQVQNDPGNAERQTQNAVVHPGSGGRIARSRGAR